MSEFHPDFQPKPTLVQRLQYMLDDCINLGVAPETVDLDTLREAIETLTKDPTP